MVQSVHTLIQESITLDQIAPCFITRSSGIRVRPVLSYHMSKVIKKITHSVRLGKG